MHFRFKSNHLRQNKGFHIEYKVQHFFTACGGNYSDRSGVISSPLHPHLYPDFVDCVYLITQPNGAYVKITLFSMDIDCQGTNSDYIEMRDGSSEDSPIMARFCGNGSNVPDSMHTSQNHMRIRFNYESLSHELFVLFLNSSNST